MLHPIDITAIAATIGYLGIFAIILIETGCFFGFFLPGDSLLFTAGLLASQHIFTIWIVIPAAIVAAISGYQVSYFFGKHLIPWLLRRKESFWFKQVYLEEAKKFYAQHGGKTLIIGRLIPVVRTFIPLVAGLVAMPWQRYLALNISGAILWAGGVTMLGFTLGNTIPNAKHYMLLIVIAIMVVSLLPAVWRYAKKIIN